MYVSIKNRHWPTVKAVVLSELKKEIQTALDELNMKMLRSLFYDLQQLLEEPEPEPEPDTDSQ